MRRERTGSVLLAAAWLTGLFLLTGVPRTGAAPLEPVTFATSAGGTVGFLTTVIKGQRIDERHRIVLDLKPFQPTDAEKALILRKVEVGFVPPITVARVNLRGSRVRVFGPILWVPQFVLVPPGSTYRSLDDLRGKRLGILDRVSAVYGGMAVAMRMRGRDLEKDYRLIFGTPPGLLALFQRGELEATFLNEPIASKVLAAGQARELTSVNEIWRGLTGQNQFGGGLTAYEDWITANVERAKRLVSVFRDGIVFVQAHPELIEKERQAFAVKTDREAELMKARLPGLYVSAWDPSVIEPIKLLIRKSVELGLLERMPDEELFIVLK